MENRQQILFEGQSEFVNSNFHKVVVKIIDKKPKKHQTCISLRGIKNIATEIISDGYSITREMDKDKIIKDQFLDSPYFNFMAEVWDSKLSEEIGNTKNLIELANELIKAEYSVTKNK